MQALNMTLNTSPGRKGIWVYYSLNEESFNVYAEPLLELLRDWANEDEAVINDLKSLNKAVKLSQSARQAS